MMVKKFSSVRSGRGINPNYPRCILVWLQCSHRDITYSWCKFFFTCIQYNNFLQQSISINLAPHYFKNAFACSKDIIRPNLATEWYFLTFHVFIVPLETRDGSSLPYCVLFVREIFVTYTKYDDAAKKCRYGKIFSKDFNHK